MLIETWRQVFRFKAIAVAQVILSATPVVPITLTGNYDTSSMAVDVAESGNYAYVANRFDGLDIIDISDPSSPSLAGNYDTSDEALGVAVSCNYAYVADRNHGLDIITAAWFGSCPTVTSSTKSPAKSSTVSPRVIPFGGEPLAVLLMLGCGSYALKKRGRHLSHLPKNSEPN